MVLTFLYIDHGSHFQGQVCKNLISYSSANLASRVSVNDKEVCQVGYYSETLISAISQPLLQPSPYTYLALQLINKCN